MKSWYKNIHYCISRIKQHYNYTVVAKCYLLTWTYILSGALDDFTTLEKPKPADIKAESATVDKAEASGSDPAKEEETEKMWADMIKQALDIDPSIRGMFQQGTQLFYCNKDGVFQIFMQDYRVFYR